MRPAPVALAALVAFALPLVQGADACDDPSDFRPVPELGLACPRDGGWLVLLDDGTTLPTHGLDPLPPPGAENDTATPLAFAPAVQPSCVADPSTEYHAQVIYSRPSNKPDRYATMAPQIRAMVREINGHLRNEGLLAAGVWTNYRVACSGGDIDVRNAVLPTPAASDSFGSIVSNLRSLGYTSGLAKYWIWHDDSGEAAGVGHLFLNDSPGANNPNNGGGMYAVTFAQDAGTMMHENGHNMGAVQVTSPFSSRAGHCNDDNDIMCYLERVGTTTAPLCRDYAHFDCNHNDYFHPNPPPGNYLQTHWNIGSRVNRFVQFSDAPDLPDAPSLAAEWTASGEITLTWTPPADTGSGPLVSYRVYRGSVPSYPSLRAVLPASETTYVESGLPPGAHYFRVAAVNAQGEGNPSLELGSARPPLAPPGLIAVAGPGLGQVTLAWLPPLSDEGSPITNYRIHRLEAGAQVPLPIPPPVADAGTATTFVDAPPYLAVWHYRVSAENAAGPGTMSPPAFVAGGGVAP